MIKGFRTIAIVAFSLAVALLVMSRTQLAWTHARSASGVAAASDSKACPKDDSGLKLPPGFCATIFADGIGHARHMVVAPNGVVYVNTWSGGYYPPNDVLPEGGFLVRFRTKAVREKPM